MKGKKLLIVAFVLIFAIAPIAGCKPKPVHTYTYNTYMAQAPSTWSTHMWQMDSDRVIYGYTEIGFYEPVLQVADSSYKWVPEMASALPVDVTSTYATADNKYFIPTGSTAGYAYKIALNPDAAWEDGVKITANDYVESMKRLLSPDYKNKRADRYIANDYAIANASNYFYDSDYGNIAGLAKAKKVEAATGTCDDLEFLNEAGKDMLFSISNMKLLCVYNGTQYQFSDFLVIGGEDDETGMFERGEGDNPLTKWLAEENETGYITATSENIEELKTDFNYIAKICMEDYFGYAYDSADENKLWKIFANTYSLIDASDFSNVGIIGDESAKTIVLIFKQPVTLFNFYIFTTGAGWLVNLPLYDNNTSTVGNVKQTKYATKKEYYKSYGPYKLTSFGLSQIKLAKNDKWYGYTDGKHTGQFQTTNINIEIVSNHNTAIQMFEQGNLDSLDLEKADLSKYGFSSYFKSDALDSNTWAFSLNGDATKLTAIETASGGSAVNLQYLANVNFRKAFSLCLDRVTFINQTTAGGTPAVSLLNGNYYYDFENDSTSRYRDTDAAKKALLEVYGITYNDSNLEAKYASLKGAFDLSAAKQLFTTAASEVTMKAGTSKIKIRVTMADAPGNTEREEMLSYISQCIQTATTGTALEGKIELVHNVVSDRYDKFRANQLEVIYAGLSGADLFPYYMIGAYADSTEELYNMPSYKPEEYNITITAKFDGTTEQTLTKTATNWYKSLNAGGEYVDASFDIKNLICSKVEKAALEQFLYVPVWAPATVYLNGMKIKFPIDEPNPMVGYGGIRFMSYNFDDTAWKTFVSSNNNQLDYTK